MRLIFAAALLALAVPASAANIYHIRWNGPLDWGVDNSNYFGLGSDLTGAMVQVDFDFDLDKGEMWGPAYHLGWGETVDPGNPYGSPGNMTVTINGLSYQLTGDNYSEYFNHVDLDSGIVDTQILIMSHGYDALDMGWIGVNYLISNAGHGGDVFKPFTLTQPVSGALGVNHDDGHMGRYADFNFGFGSQVNTLSLSYAVPEPANWALMIAGFGMTGAALRRRRVAAVAG